MSMTSDEVQADSAEYIRAFDQAILTERNRKSKRDHIAVSAIAVVILAVILGAWEAVHASGLIKPIFISDPVSVVRAFGTLLSIGSTWTDIAATFEAALVGLIIGSALGIGCGIAFSRIPRLRRAASPYVTVFNALPRPALAPIFILWFGLGMAPKVAVAVSIVFFVLLINTIAGMSSIDDDIEFLGRSLGMTSVQRFVLVEFPHATPAIIAGLRLGAVYSVLGVIVAEMIAANEGLGQLLVKFTNQFDIASSFAVLMMMAVLATILDIGVALIQRRLTWKE